MRITTPGLAHRFLKRLLKSDVEEFWAVALTSEKQVLGARCLFRGTVDRCLIHPRDVFRFAILTNASSVLVAHNHPTGEAKPSREDYAITEQLLKAARVLDLPVEDHLILAQGLYFSFLEKGSLQIL